MSVVSTTAPNPTTREAERQSTAGPDAQRLGADRGEPPEEGDAYRMDVRLTKAFRLDISPPAQPDRRRRRDDQQRQRLRQREAGRSAGRRPEQHVERVARRQGDQNRHRGLGRPDHDEAHEQTGTPAGQQRGQPLFGGGLRDQCPARGTPGISPWALGAKRSWSLSRGRSSQYRATITSRADAVLIGA